MRLATVKSKGKAVLTIARGDDLFDVSALGTHMPSDMLAALQGGRDALGAIEEASDSAPSSALLDAREIEFLPPLVQPGKIICVGLNYADHSAESGFKQPDYPTLFGRFSSSLIGHRAPIIRPRVSDQLDYEGEVAMVIGRAGRHIPKGQALNHVAGYSPFNEASVRDFQLKAPQWTVGKNFDDTGAFGPFLVTADALPPGAAGLKIETRLNGETVQSSNTSNMVFDVASLISIISEAMTLNIGDVIVTGTPAGVGLARKPPLWMKPGDTCEVEIEGIGLLSNPIAQEASGNG